MAYKIAIGSDVQTAVKAAASEQIGKAVREIHDEDISVHERVHQVRKRLKKVRAVLRLVRPALGSQYAEANALFRDLGRKLAGLRDAEAMVETVDSLLNAASAEPERRAWREVREVLVDRRRKLVHDSADSAGSVDAVGGELARAAGMIARLKLKSDGFESRMAEEGQVPLAARKTAPEPLAGTDESSP